MLWLGDSAYHAAQGLPSFNPMVISHTALDPCPMRIFSDGVLESPEHDRHVKVNIVRPG